MKGVHQSSTIMAYKYDVFLSYNRKFPHGDWVNEIFYPLFESYLCEALNLDVIIFKDSSEVMSGQAWESKLKNGIIHSKIMVSVFSPAYFRSEWCKKEFAVMDYRQKQCGYLTDENPNGLIIPIKIFDGEHFPDYVKSLQISDFSKFNRIGEGVKKAEVYTDFQGVLQNWVKHVAYAYNNVPEWDDTWKTPDWINQSWDCLYKLAGSSFQNPPIL